MNINLFKGKYFVNGFIGNMKYINELFIFIEK